MTEQLRREAAIQRIPVSQAVNEFMKYVNEHEQEDCLLVVGGNDQLSKAITNNILIYSRDSQVKK